MLFGLGPGCGDCHGNLQSLQVHGRPANRNALEKPQELIRVLWGSGNTANPICSVPLGTELAATHSSYLSVVKNLSKLYFIVIKEAHAGFFRGICWKPKAGAGNLFAVNFSHKINPIYTLLAGHVCLGSELKLGAVATNEEQIGLMGLSPLNILCGFFYPLGGKQDWSKSVLILGILCGVSFESVGQGDH